MIAEGGGRKQIQPGPPRGCPPPPEFKIRRGALKRFMISGNEITYLTKIVNASRPPYPESLKFPVAVSIDWAHLQLKKTFRRHSKTKNVHKVRIFSPFGRNSVCGIAHRIAARISRFYTNSPRTFRIMQT